MKVDINESAEKKFEPFSFTVTIETPQEARLWFHVFNKRGLDDAIFDDTYFGDKYNRDMVDHFEPNAKMREFIRNRVDIDN